MKKEDPNNQLKIIDEEEEEGPEENGEVGIEKIMEVAEKQNKLIMKMNNLNNRKKILEGQEEEEKEGEAIIEVEKIEEGDFLDLEEELKIGKI